MAFGFGTVPAIHAKGTLNPKPSTVSFSNVTAGSSRSATLKLVNSGRTNIHVSAITLSGTGFNVSAVPLPATIAGGKYLSLQVTFTATPVGSYKGQLTISSDAANPTLNVPLSATVVAPAMVSPSPSSLNFGNVTIGTSQTLSESLSNAGSSAVTISSITASGAGYSLTGVSVPLTLNAGQSVNFSVIFNPATAGAASGTVTVISNGSNPTLTVGLSGAGVAPSGTLAITPSSLDMGSAVVGDSVSQSGTLTASGGTVTVSAAVTSDSGEFTIGGLGLPATINAGANVPFTVTYSPAATGSASATLTVSSNASNGAVTAALSGTGTAPPTHSVSLSWDASTSLNIAGYNVYRATYTTVCGAFAQMNTVLQTSTVFSDSNVTNGTAYCYAATAVDSTGAESDYSNIVSDLVIPTT